MPFDALFRRESAAVDMQAALERDYLNEKILDVHAQLEVYETTAWAEVEKILSAEAQDAFRDLMNAEGDGILLARERARVIAKLREKPHRLREELAKLQADRRELEGETDV